jgi:hypothetical protein
MTELCTPTEPRERYGRKTVEAHVKQDEVRDERESGAKWLAVYAEAPCVERVIGIQMELDGSKSWVGVESVQAVCGCRRGARRWMRRYLSVRECA